MNNDSLHDVSEIGKKMKLGRNLQNAVLPANNKDNVFFFSFFLFSEKPYSTKAANSEADICTDVVRLEATL